mmetsp:Transcript_15544/g.44926  ORF Transcript_15544/g.44926 Transcript_15544/m.44926 type:complete len:257 (-) Transcript_15544:64-834(-)
MVALLYKKNNGRSFSFAPLLRALIGAAIFAFAGVSVIVFMAERERAAIQEAGGTHGLYTEDNRVCAGKGAANDDIGVVGPFVTFPSADAARRDSPDNSIAHCGHCGQCSTVSDMTIMARTTQTLTDGATWCSTKGLIGSAFLWRGIPVYRRIAAECMKHSVGFSPDCQECWMDDMECSIQKCVFTCLKSVYLLREPKTGKDGKLNTCLECDEKICGPDFLRCSGANRRRQGIHSDIGRDDDEVCQSVDVDWAEPGI